MTNVTARNPRLGLRLRFNDVVDLEHDLFVRRVTISDEANRARQVRLFASFDSYLWGYADAETAYFEPAPYRALIHYKGQRYFWFSGMTGDEVGYTSVATGNKGVRDKEGTWRDAEDGLLSDNLIAQGSVDSTGALDVEVPAGGDAVAYFWMAAGFRYADVRDLHELVVSEGPEAIIERVRSYWSHWSTPAHDAFAGLPEPVAALYRQSLLILRTQIDHGGAILAANDSDILQFGRDTYSYMWPRDGALVTVALDTAGYPELSRRFLLFAHDLITDGGFFLHKYNPDGSAGSSWHPWATSLDERQLPVQEDETALMLYALWKHYERYNNGEMIRQLYGRFIVPAARFLAAFRELRTGLPAPSFDLWEERHGIHSFTVSATWAGLMAAADFAGMFGDDQLAMAWRQAAEEIRDAALRHLYRPELGRFARTITVAEDGTIKVDPVIDSSMAGLFLFGMLPAIDPRIVRTMEAIEQRLTVRTPVGGVARYEDDYYHQISQDLENVPGNPWIICTLWLADWYIARASSPEHLERAMELIEWVIDRALPSGVLAEQIHPYTAEPLSVSPLTWSHATFVQTVQHYVTKERQMAQAGWASYYHG